jgi:hypothetical protein
MRVRVVILVLLGFFSLATTTLRACPVCDSPTGVQVRSGIFNDRFWRNVAVTLAPFPVFAAGAAWIFWGGRKTSMGVHEGPR